MSLRHVCAGLVLLGASLATGCSTCGHCRPGAVVSSAPPCCAPVTPSCPCNNGIGGPVPTISGAPPVGVGIYR